MNIQHARRKPARLGLALIVSGASGTGKSTICTRIRQILPDLAFSVSCTTRKPRPGEIDGVHYHFLGHEEFERRIQEQAFIEFAEVHGNFYGTLKSEITHRVAAGSDVLLDIDFQGAKQIRQIMVQDELLQRTVETIFIGPPDFPELERRLRGRGTESEEVIQRRLANAHIELQHWMDYDYLVINREVEQCVLDLTNLIDVLHKSTKRLKESGFYV